MALGGKTTASQYSVKINLNARQRRSCPAPAWLQHLDGERRAAGSLPGVDTRAASRAAPSRAEHL